MCALSAQGCALYPLKGERKLCTPGPILFSFSYPFLKKEIPRFNRTIAATERLYEIRGSQHTRVAGTGERVPGPDRAAFDGDHDMMTHGHRSKSGAGISARSRSGIAVAFEELV